MLGLLPPAHGVKLVVESHVGQMDHAIGQGKKGRNRADIPDILVAEAVLWVSLRGGQPDNG